ncbi:3-oxo-tetronate kinase [Aestuariirhabdus sp. LZHN29]|uniref:3-oxo-tetronate kinase n=1 Tax=Aestuariirhabdus sp. LZHN29 TaxID=3417462 RepID=UPI003CF611B2
MPKLRLGCVADDFTGASDMASFLVRGGLKTEMIDGVPPLGWHPREDTAAVVIALKSRTIPVKDAVAQSLASFRWLREHATDCQLFFKYCSTFDSTPQGNIGPVIDAVMEAFDLPRVLVSPALPVNGRTVYRGYLFVNGVPLAESPMRNHPLTPMHDSSLVRMMEQQGQYKGTVLDHNLLACGSDAVRERINSLAPEQRYLVADHFEPQHAEVLAHAMADAAFISGSSGLAEALARQHTQGDNEQPQTGFTAPGKTLILAGSCSEATRDQVARFVERGEGESLRLDPAGLMNGELRDEAIWSWVSDQSCSTCLVYSSDEPDRVSDAQRTLGLNVAERLEQAFAMLARRAVNAGIRKLVVAGGETSGAVTQALGEQTFGVGPSVAPGVPIIQTMGSDPLLLVLKSGNFGDQDFFHTAIEMMGGTQGEGY